MLIKKVAVWGGMKKTKQNSKTNRNNKKKEVLFCHVGHCLNGALKVMHLAVIATSAV